MAQLEQSEYTKLIQDLLISKPLSEAAIRPGMKILYAEGQPNGQISIDIAEVINTIDNKLNNRTRAFRGVLPTGEEGIRNFVLNHKLQIVYGPEEDKIITSIFDKDRAIDSNDIIDLSYNNGILTFQFKDVYMTDVEVAESPHVIEGDDIILFSKEDPMRMRLFVPGNEIVPDENTLEHITNKGSFWKVVQKIPNGPAGSFNKLGYRQIPDEVYERMFGCENVVTFRPKHSLQYH